MSAKYTLAALLGAPPSETDATALQFIEELTENADAIQKDVLAEILSQNAETEYLMSFNLNGATDRETFKSRIPVVTYEDLCPLIQRIADGGDRSPILTALPVHQFIFSSGTSAGQPKLFPVIEGDWERRAFGFKLLRPIMNKYATGQNAGKALYFRFVRPETKTRAGLVAQSVSAEFHRTLRSKNLFDFEPNTSPEDVVVCPDIFQSMYAQLVCGLYERRHIVRLSAAFGSTLVRAITLLRENWREMAHDIRAGSLSPKITDLSVRECMTSVMRPDPDLADLITKECSAVDGWEGIITRIWPNAKYLDAIVTGAMAQYISALDRYSKGLPIVCTRYAASECFIGVNLNPMCDPTEVAYTLLPNMAYFEFLQEAETGSSGNSTPTLVDLLDVKIGQEYEVVVTTYAGLYRCRVGDILRVSGFYNSTPQFQFVGRNSCALSIDTEKTDEADLQSAVENVSQLLREYNTSVVEYTSYADTTTVPGHYVIYLELLAEDPTDSPSDELLEQCCLVMEESFNSIYRQLRVLDKSIGALEIRVVKNGTFEALMKHAVSRGATFVQYKVSRCINFASTLDLVDSRVISKHFSPSLPHWSAGQVNSKDVVNRAK